MARIILESEIPDLNYMIIINKPPTKGGKLLSSQEVFQNIREPIMAKIIANIAVKALPRV